MRSGRAVPVILGWIGFAAALAGNLRLGQQLGAEDPTGVAGWFGLMVTVPALVGAIALAWRPSFGAVVMMACAVTSLPLISGLLAASPFWLFAVGLWGVAAILTFFNNSRESSS